MLYDPKKSSVSKIERESGVKFEHLSAPQPADVAKAAGVEAAEAISQISDRYLSFSFNKICNWYHFHLTDPLPTFVPKCSVIPAFKDAAEELLSTSGLSAVDILAKALAKAAVSFNVYQVH